MKATLDIQLIGLSQVLRDRIKDKVNEFIEQKDIWKRMWAVNEYQSVLFIRVPFFEAVKRDAFKEKIETEIQAVWSNCAVGSYVGLHECDHDEGTRKGCKISKFKEKES